MGRSILQILISLAVPTLLLGGLARWARLPTMAKVAVWTVAGSIGLRSLVGATRTVLAGMQAPPEWDFRAFWLWGQALASGKNPYNPDVLRGLAPFPVSAPFGQQILDVGCWYPPTSLVLFWPLGLLDLSRAYAAWMAVQMLAMIGCMLLAGRLLADDRPGVGFVVAAVLMPALGSLGTIDVAQTSFLVLLGLLLLMQRPMDLAGGLGLGLSLVVKPVMAPLLFLSVLARAWRAALGAAATLAVAAGAALLLGGTGVYVSYLADNPSRRLPEFVYTEHINQSLSAMLLRAASTHGEAGRRIAVLSYLVIVLALAIATAVVWRRLPDEASSTRLALGVAFALIVYPATLAHYSVLLLIPMLGVWQVRNQTRDGPVMAVALAAFLVVLVRAGLVGAALWVAWIGTAAVISRKLRNVAVIA